MTEDVRNTRGLRRLSPATTITPEVPKKCINEADDLSFFLTSRAYVDLATFIGQLNRSMFPEPRENGPPKSWPTQSPDVKISPPVESLRGLLQTLTTMLTETPPETGPRRFGNAAFKTWYRKVEDAIPNLLQQALPDNIWHHVKQEDQEVLKKELGDYLLGGFGSPTRLDYGTGHELSFIAFLGGVWKLDGFATSQEGEEERGIVIGILEPYLELIRSLIKTYSLEPAGSHGVWGLDDHSFISYILGSAQLAPPVKPGSMPPTEGSLKDAPRPGVVANEQIVRTLSDQNLYFSAIAFIYDVKKGPFWEHSPTLHDISGIQAGWAKINKGLIKMYNAEVLSKFPVVQHLRFGSLFRWETDPEAVIPDQSIHAKSQPPALGANKAPTSTSSLNGTTMMPPPIAGGAGTMAPWARAQSGNRGPVTMPSLSNRNDRMPGPSMAPPRGPGPNRGGPGPG